MCLLEMFKINKLESQITVKFIPTDLLEAQNYEKSSIFLHISIIKHVEYL